ncbi:MAG: hypothetical protein SOV63_05075 [Pyramidobacter porci]|uniref:hypothetical protein n=1 Tax=Pyramidobacter porci TaxID=2605789 RepID=UPI002A7640FF|nr:hypothetical protein [Pyramidobacter porci]MDY2648160.1 hypothetical protein [Pyramidobacter porci]
MRKSVFLMAVAGVFMGFGWRADHAAKMRKMENVETVGVAYVTERAGRKDFFVVDLRGAPAAERTPAAFEVFLTSAQLESPEAAALLKRAGIDSDAEIVLRGGTEEQTAAAAKRLLTLLNWNSLVVKRLAAEP